MLSEKSAAATVWSLYQGNGRVLCFMDRSHVNDLNLDLMKISEQVKKAAECIRNGKVVAFPTETVYGLGANALNAAAVARIFEMKERPSFDPLIVHISSIDDMRPLVKAVDERVVMLADIFWPGPLTIVSPKHPRVPDIVTSGLPTVGIRIPDNEYALALIKASGCPIAAPSANKFGRISPTTAVHVRKQLPEVDFILDGGKTQVGIESTIIELTDVGFRILRKGVITQADLSQYLPYDPTPVKDHLAAPGMMESHYSPGKRFLTIHEPIQDYDPNRTGLISFSGKWEENFKRIIRVSDKEDLKDYAVNMFEAMHTLEDDDCIDLILAEAVPEIGIGAAIMDRLNKASYNWR